MTARKARSPRRADLTADGHARLSCRQADTLWKKYTPGWDLHQLRHTTISARAAHGYNEIELKRFSGHLSLRSLEVYIAHNREAAKRKARAWERRDSTGIYTGLRNCRRSESPTMSLQKRSPAAGYFTNLCKPSTLNHPDSV